MLIVSSDCTVYKAIAGGAYRGFGVELCERRLQELFAVGILLLTGTFEEMLFERC